jgi:DNA repair protein RadA/Sms
VAKLKTVFVCTTCGTVSGKWLGQCPGCGEWNTIVEEAAVPPAKGGRGDLAASFAPSRPVPLPDVEESSTLRTATGIGEFDRVLGGGLVPASATLIGGDPGIGKSTLLLQVAKGIASTSADGRPVLYATGEESEGQVKMRAARMGVSDRNIWLLAETSLDRILAAAAEMNPRALVVDSVQTVYSPDLPAAPGSVGQVRECSGRLVLFGKKAGIAVFLVGHVTKEGAIAGPRVLEHLVDTVLYFEGDKGTPYRILKAVKNRFGSTNEIGVFEMRESGLSEVADPSGLFLPDREGGASGTVVFPAVEGTRPLLVEVQSLVTQSFLAMPRRTTLGADGNRVILLCAILERKAGLSLYNQDVFVNVAGGIRVDEPAADLPLLLAVAGSFRDWETPSVTAAFGEVGLGGEVRPVSQAEGRVAELARMGITRVVLPETNARNLSAPKGVTLLSASTVREAIGKAFPGSSRGSRGE